MSYKSYRSDESYKPGLIPPHGGYKNLLSFQASTLVYDLTVEFCKAYLSDKSNQSYRLLDQMIQAARSGRQNIAEGSQASGTSKKTELKLMNVARASLEELLLDYQDFLRQRALKLWPKDSKEAKSVRDLAYRSDKSYESYQSYFSTPESAANTVICLIHQTNYLLSRQIIALEKSFLEEGGFTEKLYSKRKETRGY